MWSTTLGTEAPPEAAGVHTVLCVGGFNSLCGCRIACGSVDKTVRVWSISKRKLVKKAVLDTMARAVDWSPDGTTIAVGLGGRVAGGAQKKDGAVSID